MKQKDKGKFVADAEDSPINIALRQFEAAEANLAKLERLWSEIVKLIPPGIQFGNDPGYEEQARLYEDVLAALPKIDGWKPTTVPLNLNAIAQNRFDAMELDEIDAKIAVENEIEAPGQELADYRHRLNKKRRQLIRSVVPDRIAEIDETMRALNEIILKKPDPSQDVKSIHWEKLKKQIQEIETLLGSALSRPPRWSDLRRHLHFGTMHDLADVIRLDWPEVKTGLTRGLYGPDEPIPVEVEDLGVLAASQPKGHVVTKLKWETLSDEDFERLVFSLISAASGYENPEWLMHTNAPDRGRDLSVFRVSYDSLAGSIRSRVLIQCRHWTSRSVAVPDIAALKEQIKMWEPPKIDVLIIATTGRFTSDAVSIIERNNVGDHALKIEMWPESHLERLLAERPAVIGDFRLR